MVKKGEIMKEKGKELLRDEAIRSIDFLVSVREGAVEGKNINHRIAAARILIDKVYPSGGDKSDKGESVVRIEVVDLTAPVEKPTDRGAK
ncbi:MAG: hypothetical protein EDM75_05270 [Chlorobiota bacterium]|nr:MAG: hypothetical protein EDM75_05270 [Chlorobiota bacterium]